MKNLTIKELQELVSELFEALKDEVKFCKDNELELSAQSVLLINKCKSLRVEEINV